MGTSEFTTHRGVLLAFEGIDGSGKATQVALLREFMLKIDVPHVVFSFPDYGGPLGESIRQALRDAFFDPVALQLLLSAERVRHRPFLLEALSEGKLILLDRYKWSAYAYAVARGLPPKWVQNLEVVLPEPDLTILLDLPPDLSIARTGASDSLELDIKMLSKCRRVYLDLARRLPNWTVLDATSSREDLHSSLRSIIEQNLPAHRRDIL